MASRRRTRRRGPARVRVGRSKTGSRQPRDKFSSPSLSSFSLVPPKLQQHLLETITACVESGRSPQEVAQVCLQVFLELTEARAAAVYLQDEQTRHMRCMATSGEMPSDPSQTLDSLVPRVIREGCLVKTDDLLAFPLKRLRTLEGVLIVHGLPQEEKQASQVSHLLDFVAARLAIGIDHSRLAQKYAEKIARIRQLEQVSEILNSSLEEMDALTRAIEAAITLVEAETGSLLLFHGDQEDLSVEVVVGKQAERLQHLQVTTPSKVLLEVAKTGQPLIVNDVHEDPRFKVERLTAERDPKNGFEFRSLLAVPVRTRNRTLGVLEAANKKQGRIFSKWDLEEFGSLSSQIAIVLDNARLFRDYQGKIRRLQKLEEISSLLNSTLNQDEIRKRAIEAATTLMEAEAGSLLLLDEAAGELYFEVALGEKGEGVRQIRLKLGQGIAGHVAQTGEPVIINDVQHDPRFSQTADKRSGFVTRNMVCVPVKARDKLLGVLQAINKRDGGIFRHADMQDFVSLGHQVGIAIENANLYEEINRLFEGFISASVMAIESRDPTTSGHSGRVATLTCGLAEIVDRLDHGPYANVTFDYDQMKEIRYAAVLHDFGKVGVRENILIKAQKLFPGDLALLKARFDFIKRTFEVQSLQKKLEILMSGDRAATVTMLAQIDEELARKIADTEGILEFLLASNRPTVLPTGGFERLHSIASMTYDHFEGARPYLTPDEVLTLSIPKGSLTTEERLEIESHVTHTYRFLSTIPWTKKLKNIPVIAYGHHEKLDGTGYPRQVLGETISVQTRMMTISDIYDALTAADRPYKAAVPITTALQILEAEVKQGKVDAVLLKIFVEAKVYQRVHGTT